MKYFAILILTLSVFVNSCKKSEGCRDMQAYNFDSEADKDCNDCCKYKGGVLFWVSNQACGAISVTLNNGQNTIIQGYYPAGPSNCVNDFGGYVLLDVGTYTYTATSVNGTCTPITGTINVSNGCNRIQLF
jgi:hypothetical protein